MSSTFQNNNAMGAVSSHLSLAYRPDVDGLRAVAVLPVILFHAGLSALPGGFAGVDVFFVISGYLITGLILKALDKGSFRFSDFYFSRARRILPALFAMCAATLALAWGLMLPEELSAFGHSLLRVMTYSSNHYFAVSTDYFAPSSETQPLLHTWSLAVEEQFYFLFPLVLVGLWRWRRTALLRVLVALAVLSFLLSLLGGRNFQASNYYLLPTRAWELLAGAILAVLQARPAQAPAGTRWRAVLARWPASASPALGLALLAASFVLLNEQVAYPGIATLAPVLGALLVLWQPQPASRAGRFLAWRPLVLVGKVSYSAYLWHFPLLSLRAVLHASRGETIALGWVLLALACVSYASYRFIEQPVRRVERPSVRFWGQWLSLQVLLLAVGLVLQSRVEWVKPHSPSQLAVMDRFGATSHGPQWDDCARAPVSRPCIAGDAAAARKIVLFGDSHAFTLYGPLGEALRARGRQLVLHTDGNCPPLYTESAQLLADRCLARNREIYADIAKDPQVEAVILLARWSWYFHVKPFDNQVGGVGEKVSKFLAKRVPANQVGPTVQSLWTQTLDFLPSLKVPVYLVNTIPEPGWSVRRKSLHLADLVDDPADEMVFERRHYQQRNAAFDATLRRHAPSGVTVVDSAHAFCTPGEDSRCFSWAEGRPLYFDDNHLNEYGARRLVGPLLEAALKDTRL